MLRVFRDDLLVGEFHRVSDTNIDGTLRIYQDGLLIAEFKPLKWTHVEEDPQEPQGNAGWDYEQDG